MSFTSYSILLCKIPYSIVLASFFFVHNRHVKLDSIGTYGPSQKGYVTDTGHLTTIIYFATNELTKK